MPEKIRFSNEPNNNKLPNELERQHIASGADSYVSKLNKIESLPTIFKEYKHLQDRRQLSPDEIIKALNRYREDTQKVALLLEKNSNPINQEVITDSGEKWQLHFIVVPQGGNIQKDKDGFVYAEGQDFITGENYGSLLTNRENEKLPAKEGYECFILSDIGFYVPYDCLKKLGQYINEELEELGAKFSVVGLNVKPKIDRQQKILNMYITDLAASLYRSYIKDTKNSVEKEKETLSN